MQINSKIAELDIEKEELQRIKDMLARLEDMVRVLERSNEAIITDNTVFHDRIRHVKTSWASSPLCGKVATTSHPNWK